jgi:glycosyltransferase involved in cell wall biosynthesis
MKIAIVNNQAPFVRGGAELLADWLDDRLRDAGHESQVIRIPFSWRTPQRVMESMLAVRLIELHEADRVIALKFPAYYVRHENKVLWLLHQFRQAYELRETEYDALGSSPRSAAVAQAIKEADTRLLGEARALFTNSRIVRERLTRTTGLDAEVLYPPLGDESGFRCESFGDYVFCPARLSAAKRQMLLVEATARTRSGVRLVIAGPPDDPRDLVAVERAIERCGVGDRVELLAGWISEERKRELFANALACAYIPFDEDSYGYVSLEAFHSRKPVITCNDSGGTLELVEDNVTGIVAEPDPGSLADAFDRLRHDPATARQMGEAGYERMQELHISWDHVVSRLTST